MNAALPDSHPSIRYYDSDYPSRELSPFPGNFDDITALQGLAHDVERYAELARETGSGDTLELCCGSGRVSIPLARLGHRVVGVDLSAGMLDLFRNRLAQESAEVAGRITLVQQDVSCLDLPCRGFGLVIIPFNSLMCIPDFGKQCDTVAAAADHLRPGGTLVLDLMNPLALSLAGDPTPRPFFTRRNVHNGNRYTRFAAMGPMGVDQVQRLWGWYDEIAGDGTVRRTDYSMDWRPIFRYELELMLQRASFRLRTIEGGHLREPFTISSRKMFAIAERLP